MKRIDAIHNLLTIRYGITPKTICEVQGGWSAKAYRINTGDHSYFLKAYDKSLPSIRPWIKRIDNYMPVLGWLSGTPELGKNVIHPITTIDSRYKAETAEFVYVLFDYIVGETPGEKGLTDKQTTELAGIIARLHNLKNIACDNPGLAEDLSIPFCEKIKLFLEKEPTNNDLSRLIFPHTDILREAIMVTSHLRDTVRIDATPLVLCHADAHPFNVIQSDRLVLVDFEDLKWAPAEIDLIIYALSPNWEVFWNAYSAVRPDFQINSSLMKFYLIRRRLDDIWSDIARISYEKPNEEEIAQMNGWVKNAISDIKQLLSG
ncbi:MAG: aminoglycoside phosphotransferase family protein [Bacillota bacterium]|nr:aminoglycoside phosphotransferase family protein [Bacillota bacterium]